MMWEKACKSCMGLLLTAMLLAGTAFAAPTEEAGDTSSAGKKQQTEKAVPKGEKRIVINIASRSLALYQGGEKIRLYPLCLGKPSTPTPTGYYKINSKDVNPTWTDPSDLDVVIPSGESNPLGYRWMLLYGNYGIHGTNRPESIGTYGSNGCIRLNEKDVEALFDLVDISTPVEITYNRIVVEKIEDNTVVYYIYPDGYGRQPLDAKLVDKWLSGYGINAFVSDEAIEKKIAASDGKPTYIGKVYNIFLDGKKLSAKAAIVDGVTYLPASDVGLALGTDIQWKPEEESIVTPYGMAKGYNKKNVLYFNALDMGKIFRVEGKMDGGKSFVLHTIPVKKEPPVAATPVPSANSPAPTESEQSSVGTAKLPAGTAASVTPASAEEASDPAPAESSHEAKAPSSTQFRGSTTVNQEREALPADKKVIQPKDGLEEVR